MKKLLYSVVIVFFLCSHALALPFISLGPCAGVEKFEVQVNALPPKLFTPEINDTLILDVEKDFGIKQQTSKTKITIVAINSDGASDAAAFYLRIFKFFNYYIYKIEPIPEPDNPFYLDKYEEDQLEVRMIKKYSW